MKLVTFKTADGRVAPGVLQDDLATIVDLSFAFPDMLALLDAGEAGLDKARGMAAEAKSTFRLADVKLLSPVPVPRRIRDCSVFEAHVKGGAMWAEKMGFPLLAKVPDIWYKQPIFYKGNHLNVVGTDTDIPWPTNTKALDYELEIAAVIGKKGKDIGKENAMDHVVGFMIFNDLTRRDSSFEISGLMGPAKAKDFDCGNILGPWLVTKDEIADIYNMKMTARLNGDTMGSGTTGDMYHRWDAIVAYASEAETIYPGEVIGSGTIGGGMLAEKGRFLNDGDVVEFEIDGLGVLRNRVTQNPASA